MVTGKLAATALLGGLYLAAPGEPARLSLPFANPVRAVGENCWVARDLVVQALEQMRPDSPNAQLDDANQLLQRAVSLCNGSGDAWYYRSLVEAKLGRPQKVNFLRAQASMLHSEAMDEALNPFVLATPPPKSAPPPPPVHRKWALVIGISTFTDPKMPPLRFTSSDAKSFRDVLVDAKAGGFDPGDVHLLADESATLPRIKAEINWLARSAAPEDLVVVYVATHGSSRTQDTREANYIVTSDTVVSVDMPGSPYERAEDALYATALPMVDLVDAISTRLRSRRAAIFLDTCYSGGVMTGGSKDALVSGIRGGSVSEATLSHASEGSGRIVFAASKRDEQSWESEKLKHGYFTYHLVQAIRAHPEMPLTQIFATVRKNVSADVDADHQHLDQQTPVISRSADNLDFALGTPQTVARAAATNSLQEKAYIPPSR